MRSLFSRIFLSLIFIILLFGVSGLMLSYLVPRGPVGGLQKHLMNLRADDLAHLLLTTGLAAAKIMDTGGEKELINYLLEAGEQKHDRFFLLREDYTTFSGRKLPEGAVALVVASRNVDHIQSKRKKTKIMIALPLEHSGEIAAIVGITTKRVRSPAFVHYSGTSRVFMPIILMMLFAAPVCYLLARSLTAPIRKLQKAARRISNGDYSARVDLLKNRGDEISELSHDFNTMVDKTQSLLQSQKRLLRDISHELRSPLTRLNMALGLTRQKFGEAEPYLLRIEKESERIDELIGQLLTLARFQGDVDNHPKEAVNIQKLVTNIVHDVSFEAETDAKIIEIKHLDDVTILGSEEMLSRALENVIRNGLRYTAAKNSVEIDVRKQGNQAIITVLDHGSGVPDDLLLQIFKPFFRVEESRDRDSGGTGIGLAIAKQAVLMHGGLIEAKNSTPGGLMVLISLPLLTVFEE